MLKHAQRYLLTHRRELIKFVIVGVVTFGVYLASFHLFYGLPGLGYRIAVTLAYIVTVIAHFLLHRFYTFNAGEQDAVHNAGRYLMMLAFNYAVTMAVVWLVVEVVGFSPYIGVIASTATTACLSFIVMKYFVFRAKEMMWRSS